MCSIQLESSLWTPIAGEDTFLGHPQYCMVRRENLEYFPRGRSYWDRHLLGGYLSSRLVSEQLGKTVMESMNWPSLTGTLECEVRPVLGSPELKLEIQGLTQSSYDSGERFYKQCCQPCALAKWHLRHNERSPGHSTTSGIRAYTPAKRLD